MKKTPFFHRHTAIQKLLILKALCIKVIKYFTVSGPIVTFFTNIAHPVTALKIGIEPVQDTSGGDPSPNHVCPITGWDAVHLTGTGKNLFNPSSAGNEWVNTSSVIETKTAAKSVRIKCSAGDTFTLSNAVATTTAQAILISFIGENNTVLSRKADGIGGTSVTATAPANAVECLASCLKWSAMEDVQFEKGSTATAYESFGTTHTASLPSTVFGGEVEWVNGVLKVTHAIVDLGSLSWTYSDAYQYFRSSGVAPKTLSAGTVPIWWCEVYKIVQVTATSGWSSVSNNSISMRSDGQVCIKDTAYTDGTALAAALSGKYLVYELATPTEIPLSDLDEISTIAGENNLWADTGDILLLTYAKKV